jgi:hypothetical protein
MIGRQFNWANSLCETTYEKLDRVLMNNWEDKFPHVSICALECTEDLLDHAPIFLTTGMPRPQSTRLFKFELGWLHREGFPRHGYRSFKKTCYWTYHH